MSDTVAEAGAGDDGQVPDQATHEPPDRMDIIRRSIVTFNWREALLLPFLAFITALFFSAVIIAVSDIDNLERLDDDFFGAIWDIIKSIGEAFWALLKGAFGSLRASSETLTAATPLILAGLGLGLGFRAGLFNIGAQGQMIMGGLLATIVGFQLSVPTIIHIPLVILGGLIGGAAYGAIPGYLRAKTGAHEVIVTIMLNNIAVLFLTWALTKEFMQQEGRDDPISKTIDKSGRLPGLFGFLDRSDLRVSFGFVMALVMVWFVWWLLFRSTLGFEFRAVGSNPAGAKYAGMKVTRLYVMVMAISGGLAGLAAVAQVAGLFPYRATPGFVGVIGFDAISIALLGRSHPVGILAAGLLFGALRAGGQEMQAATDVPIDMILVVQAFVVIFIAAPALIKAIWRVDTGEDKALTSVAGGWGQ